jgi:PleD family two-component response regulator
MRGQDFINETLRRASQDIVATSSRNRALTDSLTGLANRRAFMDRLDQSQCR